MMVTLKTTCSFPRIAVLGCGVWGQNLIRNFAELGVLVALCDIDSLKAKKLASQYDVMSLSEDELLHHPDIDAVAIASDSPLHANQAERALIAGKHVYVEKPMALSLKDAQRLCSLAKIHDRILMVGHILNYHPAFIALKDRLPELGPLRHIYANRLGLGRFRRQESVLWDLASHDVSLILSLAQEAPKNIMAIGQTFLRAQKSASSLLTLTFPSGLTAHIHASWLSPFKEQKLVVVGEEAIAVFDDCKPWKEKLRIAKGCVMWKKDEPLANNDFHSEVIALSEVEPLKNECMHFINCLQKNQQPLTSGEEGLRVTEVLEAAERFSQGDLFS